MSEFPTYDDAIDEPGRLLIQLGPDPGREIILSAERMSLGRSATNDIVVNDPEISRRHAQITYQNQRYLIEDLGSTNGTFVNGQRCTGPTSLKDGDVVEFGDTIQMLFVRGPSGQRPYAEEDESAFDTPSAPLAPPPQAAVPPQPMRQQPMAAPAPVPSAGPLEEQENGRRNRYLIGCIALLVLACCLCGLLLVVLDAYNQGQLLYCGGLRPFWEAVLGPIGFNPICP